MMSKENEKSSFTIYDQPEPSSSTSDGTTENTPLVRSTKTPNIDASTTVIEKSGKELRKSLGFRHAFACVVSIIFASGIFISPSLVAKQASNMGMALLAWIIAGFASLSGALCFCELVCMYKRTGSYYVFIFTAYGDLLAFMIIFIQLIVIAPSAFAILALAIGEHIIDVLPNMDNSSGDWFVKVVGILLVVLAAAMNCISTAFLGRSQILFTTVQSLSAIFLVLLGIIQVASGHIQHFTEMFNNANNSSFGEFGLALYNALWAYDGWSASSSIAEELQNLERNLWMSFVIGIPFVMVCYLCLNLAYISVLNKNEIASKIVASTFVAKIVGSKASYIIPATVTVSCFGGIAGGMFMCAREFLSAAREGHLPVILSYIHRDRRTPIPSILCQCLLTIIWMLPSANEMEVLITHFNISVWLKYLIAISSVLVMRQRRPDLARPFKVWLPIPILTTLFSCFLIIIPFIERPMETTLALLIFLVALPVYYIPIKKYHNLPHCVHKSSNVLTTFMERKFNLVPCVFKEEVEEKIKENKQYKTSKDTEVQLDLNKI